MDAEKNKRSDIRRAHIRDLLFRSASLPSVYLLSVECRRVMRIAVTLFGSSVLFISFLIFRSITKPMNEEIDESSQNDDVRWDVYE